MTTAPRRIRTRVSDVAARRVGFGIIAALALLLVADVAVALSEGSAAIVAEDALLGITFCLVLTISIRAQPRNVAVWTMLTAATFGLLSQVGANIGFAITGFSQDAINNGEIVLAPSDIEPLAALAFAIGLTAWLPGTFLLAIHLLITFPAGRVESVRWRRTLWATAIMMGLAVVAGVVRVGPWVDRPYDELLADDMAFGPPGVVIVPLMLAALLAVVHLIRRYRASAGEERLQYRWVTWALAIYVVNIFTYVLPWPDPVGRILSTLALANIAVAFGVAILKYRLYEIDRIISRSVTFGALALFIGGVYVGIVVGVRELIPGAGFWLQIVASVAVAMAFQPARRRVQRWANRLVYGERATPYEVLVRFSRRSAELSDEELLRRIPQLMVAGTGATSAALWTRTDGGFRTAAMWPDDAVPRRLDDVSTFLDPESDYSSPVFHDGDLLGGLSLAKEAGEAVTSVEQALLSDLGSGLGLALRNTRLTAELRRQVAELEASRERILAASDAAKRALENDLDSGPQQTLVAVKVKLGPTRKRAEQLGADKTARLLTQLEIDAGEAIRAVRDFASGIYPPLLEAEGLAVAIAQQARTSPIPVSVHGGGVKRYVREVEAAVYFSVLEALQNTAKYAEATAATVALVTDNGTLTFEVSDDGHGFEPTTVHHGAGLTGIADRLDTIGGRLRVDSSPGHGTRITGTIPIQQPVGA